MGTDLFAGIPVSNYERALSWYEALLGSAPSFLPNDTEAVWDVNEHGYLYVDVQPERAGFAAGVIPVGPGRAPVWPPGAAGGKPQRLVFVAVWPNITFFASSLIGWPWFGLASTARA